MHCTKVSCIVLLGGAMLAIAAPAPNPVYKRAPMPSPVGTKMLSTVLKADDIQDWYSK